MGKFNAKIKHYSFLKITNAEVYGAKERQIKISLIGLTQLMFQINMN